MDSYITIALVEYIHLLHRGKVDKSLFTYFEEDLKNCLAHEVNIAIENLIIRYKDVDVIDNTVAKLIRAATIGLESQQKPEYPTDSIFHILDKENRSIEAMLVNLKKTYLSILPDLKGNIQESKSLFKLELKKIEAIKKHYHKLQYGVFSALEAEGAPTRCIQLMWHLEDSIWPKLKDCMSMLSSGAWDYNQFNKTYGQMFFLTGSLVIREDRILFPVAYKSLSVTTQRQLMKDAASYGIIAE